MRSTLVLALLGIASLALGAQDARDRPKITGIDHVAFYTTAPERRERNASLARACRMKSSTARASVMTW